MILGLSSAHLHFHPPFLLIPLLTIHALNTEFDLHLQTATSLSTEYTIPAPTRHSSHAFADTIPDITSTRLNPGARTQSYLKRKNTKCRQSGKLPSRLSRPTVVGLASFANKITFSNESCRCVAMETKHIPEKGYFLFISHQACPSPFCSKGVIVSNSPAHLHFILSPLF